MSPWALVPWQHVLTSTSRTPSGSSHAPAASFQGRDPTMPPRRLSDAAPRPSDVVEALWRPSSNASSSTTPRRAPSRSQRSPRWRERAAGARGARVQMARIWRGGQWKGQRRAVERARRAVEGAEGLTFALVPACAASPLHLAPSRARSSPTRSRRVVPTRSASRPRAPHPAHAPRPPPALAVSRLLAPSSARSPRLAPAPCLPLRARHAFSRAAAVLAHLHAAPQQPRHAPASPSRARACAPRPLAPPPASRPRTPPLRSRDTPLCRCLAPACVRATPSLAPQPPSRARTAPSSLMPRAQGRPCRRRVPQRRLCASSRTVTPPCAQAQQSRAQCRCHAPQRCAVPPPPTLPQPPGATLAQGRLHTPSRRRPARPRRHLVHPRCRLWSVARALATPPCGTPTPLTVLWHCRHAPHAWHLNALARCWHMPSLRRHALRRSDAVAYLTAIMHSCALAHPSHAPASHTPAAISHAHAAPLGCSWCHIGHTWHVFARSVPVHHGLNPA
ncbi:hypothetical protein DENSPDRAFT_887298 [Dentipellis sp. KUC8613]|nr:hypothetical protein DENSPDRAFT_887298 [Dentipellis sp. KUC8613]